MARVTPRSTAIDVSELGFAAYGDDIRIYRWVRILDAERISIGSHIVVDDFVMLQGGEQTTIGNHVHIASFASITGGGIADLGHFCGIASGTRILTGSDRFDGTGLTGPTVPDHLRSVERGTVVIGAHAVIGANSVVQPGVTVGEGAIVGAGGVVLHDLEPWTIYVGAPARPIKPRPKERLLELARRLDSPE